jgi:membrane protein DedA with SNARE-associated domain
VGTVNLLSASVTEGLVNSLAHLVRDGGLPAIFALMAVSAACIPIPSEVVMLFAGFAVADPLASGAGQHHHLTMVGIVLAGLLGTVVGSWLAYAVGRGGRLELLERHGRLLHVGPAQIRRADAWFRRYGAATVLVGRVVPFVRAFVSLPAGVARMRLVPFTVLTAIGSGVWVLALAFAGDALGSEWKTVRRGFEYVDYVVLALIVVGIGYAWLHRRRARRSDTAPAPGAGEAAAPAARAAAVDALD